MFEVENYRISFHKSLPLFSEPISGRFDTVCVIDIKHCPEYPCSCKGTAYLHPKDMPNKIIGKKVALTKALASMADKHLRTIIWKAFWKWVESWKAKI